MRFLTNILAKAGLIVDGTTQLNTIANATIDTDKFLVSDSGVVKYRTGAQVLSDIGASSSAAGLPIGGTAGQILAKIDATNYNTQWIDNYAPQIQHIVKLGTAMSAGTAVYVSSADGTNMIVSKASNDSEATSTKTLGLIKTGGVLNDQVFVVTEGLLAGLDTSTANAGDPVWLGVNGAILFGLANKPVAPAHMVFIGIVTRVQSVNGEIFVKVQNGFELNELHDVSLPSYVSNGVLYRDTTTNLWKTASISTVLGYTPANAARQLTINGTTYDLTADRTWSVGTVTSIATTGPITGGTITGSGTIGITQATTSSNGYLSSTDWNTFNNKQNALTLTTTGSSGASTLVGATLNIPTYSLSGLGGVPTSRQLTINGVAYDLSADRSWSVGTVTSVGVSVPTGLTVSNTPVTGSGTIAIAFAAGYSIPTTSSQANWTTAYNDSIVSAAVTGTTTKTLTLTQQDGGTVTASWTDYDTAPVTSVNAGTGISVNATTGAVTVTNTGVLSINGSTGAITGIITTSNYNSYSPTLTGSGASGTWGINITGNAGYASSAGNADTVDGLHASAFVRTYQTTNNNIDSDYGECFITFDPIPSGTPPIASPNIRTINVGNDFNRRTQLAFNYSTDQAWFRRKHDASWQTWREFIHSGNIGSQSVSYASSAGNADTVDGYHASTSTIGNYIVVRDGNGYIFGNYINMTDDGNPGGGTSISSFITKQGDNYYRSVSPTNAMASIRGVASGSWGINVTGSAGSVDFNNLTSKTGGTGTYQTSGDFRAPIFYDSNDTSYYLDPNSLSRIDRLQVVSNWGGTTPNNGQINIRGNYPSMTFRNPSSGSMWLRHMDGNGDIQHYYASDGVDSVNWSIKHTMFANGTFFSSGSMRSPIFYDSENTAYYVDPNATSYCNRVDTNQSYTYGWFRNLSNNTGLYNENTTQHLSSSTNGYWDVSSTTNASSGVVGIRLYAGGHVNTLRGYLYSDGSGVGLLNNQGGWSVLAYQGSSYGGELRGAWTATGDMRAPIFYDSNNTSYYADFASTGTSIYTAGTIRSAGMNMRGAESAGSFGGQIYPTVSYGGISLYGGNTFTNGAYFTVTGIDYGSSPGAGSAEFVIRTEATSKFAMYSYNGSTYTGRYSLWGSTGNVTIGSATTDYGYRLYVLGDIYATGSITSASDAKLKTNIREIENPLDRVLKSRGVIYDRIDGSDTNAIGFIAQEIEDQFPELVSIDSQGTKGVKYQNMVAVLLEAIKEQQKQINKLQSLINK